MLRVWRVRGIATFALVVLALGSVAWLPQKTYAAAGSPPTNYTNDALPDFEPTITRALNAAGATATVTVSIKEITSTDFRNYYVVNDGTSRYTGYLPTPPDKNRSVDPYLYPNQRSTGKSPYRLYCVGLLIANTTDNADAITVWRSDDMGRDGFTRLPYSIVETGATRINRPDGVTYEERILDMPTITINDYAQYRGDVYVAYRRLTNIRDLTGHLQRRFYSIYVARSINGGDTWETPVRVWTNDDGTTQYPPPANVAHVVSNPRSGYVYVTWVVYKPTNQIMLARSPSPGTINGTWLLDTTGPSGNFTTNDTSKGMQSATTPITRFNWVANKITLVWNERESSSDYARSDVYYAEKSVNGWTTWNGVNKLKISNEAVPCINGYGNPTTTDQLRPTLDFDASGKMTIAYYDRKNDCLNNDRYDVYFAQVSTGSTTPAAIVQAPTRLTTFTSDVDENHGRIGEYFDIWCETAVCYTAWVGTPNTQGDIFVSTIQ